MEPGPRRDAVVILARGEGRRMGGPKAGLVLPGDERPFAARIAATYAGWGWPVTLVLGPDHEIPAGTPANLRVLTGPSGGDTALTLATAWRADARDGSPPTHYWAHPVDLPLVDEGTVGLLAGISREGPAALVRPEFEGRPGHPVVVPCSLLGAIAEDPECRTLSFREALRRHPVAVRAVAVADRGVVQDFDQPDDLARERPEEETS